MTRAGRFAFLIPALVLLFIGARPGAQQDASTTATTRGPAATLSRTTTLLLTGRVDSNSPAVWDRVDGADVLHVFTSFDGYPSRAVGPNLQRLAAARPVTLSGFDGGGYWLEAVVKDVDGTLYGYYHNERTATACRDATRVIPRIGAARSIDQGQTWENVGILLESSRAMLDCSTVNKYFVGG